MAAATTSIDATPSATKVASPAISMPAIAIITVKPEMSTAWPEVDAASSSARRRLERDSTLAAFSARFASATASPSPERFAALTAAFAAPIAAASTCLVASRSRRSRCR